MNMMSWSHQSSGFYVSCKTVITVNRGVIVTSDVIRSIGKWLASYLATMGETKL